MAQTFTTATMGVTANDGSGNPIRTGGNKIAADLAELYAGQAALEAGQVAASDIIRAGSGTATGVSSERINYSSEFTASCQISTIDALGVGVQVTAQDATGFDYDSLSAGTFGYTALIDL